MICTCPVPLEGQEHRAAYTLLAWALHRLHGFSGRLVLSRTPEGKPFLHDFPKVRFSVSHCTGMVACAVDCVETGVDIEAVRPYSESLTYRCLAPVEREQLLGDSREREEAFFRFWTLKESYGKALGTGLGYPLREVSFHLGDPPKSNVPGYFFIQKVINKKFILSVCKKGIPPEQTVTVLRHLPEWIGGITYEDGSIAKPEGFG